MMVGNTLETFAELKHLLFSIAYRMLGSVMDAEDMVQETYIRWQNCKQEDIDSPRSWLSTVITRLCINYLKSARVQREMYVGPWLPEPLVADAGVSAMENSKLSDSLSLAFLVILENLTPTERAVFVLREVFSYEFAEIAPIVEKSEANCRQILARARRRVDERQPRFEAAPQDAENLINQFEHAIQTGDLDSLLAVLAKDVVFVSDGGGKARAVLRPISGADHVGRLLIGAAKKFGSKTQVLRHVIINNLPGTISCDQGRILRVLCFGIRDNRICSIYVIANPDKLRHLPRYRI
jgi:RNA polymerase sigma-70 factor (ECF subfamily)